MSYSQPCMKMVNSVYNLYHHVLRQAMSQDEWLAAIRGVAYALNELKEIAIWAVLESQRVEP